MDRRVSVRALVEFSVFEPDLSPASREAMLFGAMGHKSRQKTLTEAGGYKSEVSISRTFDMGGDRVTVQGRMDAFMDGEIPVIEEIKVPASGAAPAEAHEAHRLQAVVYAYMTALRDKRERVIIRILYSTRGGEESARFDEELSVKQLEELFFPLLEAWLSEQLAREKWLAERDASIRALSFPFPEYRGGQREMAVRVYTAISLRRRLVCMLPTGTGKSAGVLFPAIKAMGEGKTKQIFYLTARTTAREAAMDSVRLMYSKGLMAKLLVISAKEKVCTGGMRCHPDDCACAKGFYLRLPDALKDISRYNDWDRERASEIAEKYSICPFEFSLRLAETADIVVCDYNYAFDPMVRLQRIFEKGKEQTLLADEAHNLPSRVREMLSGGLSSGEIAETRREAGKLLSRKASIYKSLTALLKCMKSLSETNTGEGRFDEMPQRLVQLAEKAADDVSEMMGDRRAAPMSKSLFQLLRMLLPFLGAAERAAAEPSDYKALYDNGNGEQHIKLLALNISTHLAEMTAKLPGTVYFSATLTPLDKMKTLLGGSEEDGFFEAPSPFPKENLLLMRKSLSTRYTQRERTANEIAQALVAFSSAKKGNYLFFFPSYKYLLLIRDRITEIAPDLEIMQQESGQSDEKREEFLNEYRAGDKSVVGMAVLGGSYAESVDLPGDQLIGVAVVGVGLPMVCLERETMREYYSDSLGDGFGFAYRYPGMQKVLQAAGRVIRTKTDRGAVLLIDDRYMNKEYYSLLPEHFSSLHESADIRAETEAFFV
ncbi:MAG: ATP-dependent DNA helicase [Eubacteriales bacterium]|nr:ATP-dependent DNA helicase [Eubacteriales bacterium]MDD3881819.1 ATP-dependent DNA helicase [Eubacteriales bacterium]MDD4513684.1 ATP-dependent DNA helicase [Eubacteriales bacterium]